MRDHIFSRASSLGDGQHPTLLLSVLCCGRLLLFPYALSVSVKAVGHDHAHRGQVVCWSEAAHWQISAVLDRLVAARRRHILRHGSGVVGARSVDVQRRSSVAAMDEVKWKQWRRS